MRESQKKNPAKQSGKIMNGRLGSLSPSKATNSLKGHGIQASQKKQQINPKTNKTPMHLSFRWIIERQNKCKPCPVTLCKLKEAHNKSTPK